MVLTMNNEKGDPMKKDNENKILEWTRIIVETDEENPKTIAEITADGAKPANGFRIRLKPPYDD